MGNLEVISTSLEQKIQAGFLTEVTKGLPRCILKFLEHKFSQ